ncbi:MAG: DUF4383 domain-containing protein [Trueperaceae bacterium]
MATRYFALIAGIVYVLAGLLGFLPGAVHDPVTGDPDVGVVGGWGYLIGLFPVNFLHNLVHLALGAWGLMAYRDFMAARGYARGLTIIYGVLAVMGVIPGLRTVFGLVPIFGNDIWLHAVTAVVAAYFGWGRAEEVPVSTTATSPETPTDQP